MVFVDQLLPMLCETLRDECRKGVNDRQRAVLRNSALSSAPEMMGFTEVHQRVGWVETQQG
jgi:hypothetical protein